MAAFIADEMQGIFLEEAEFSSGKWTAKIQNLLELDRMQPKETNGAEQISGFIQDRIFPECELHKLMGESKKGYRHD